MSSATRVDSPDEPLASAPAVLIIVPLEGRPQVVLSTLHDTDEQRLRHWLESSGLDELVDLAHDLAAEEPAA